MTRTHATTSVVSEFAALSLGDPRLDSRLRSIVRDLARAPAKSLPRLLPSSAKLEAAYRFYANGKVKPEAVLAPHVAETAMRAGAHAGGTIRILHDTTRFAFSGDRENLGTLTKETRGFFAHVALAVGSTEEREPLGVLRLETFVNDDEGVEARRKLSKSEIDAEWKKTPREDKARKRWERGAIEAAKRLPPGVRGIHVMDQEANDFHVFIALLEKELPFVIRGAGSRLTTEGTRLDELLNAQEHHAFLKVRVSRRPKSTRKKRGLVPRDERDAELRIRFAPVTIRRPNSLRKSLPTLSVALHVVHVFEPNPPEGEEAIDWVLFTSERVTTLEEALKVVDHYRARWLIEEFFKALKTGCSFEKRQLTTFDGLQRLLATFVPIAWQLLRMRHLARQPKPPPASAVMNELQLRILRALLADAESDFVLPTKPTVRDVLFGIAALGGHIRNNGDPGWLVIGRGYEDFVAAERVWRVALSLSDQS